MSMTIFFIIQIFSGIIFSLFVQQKIRRNLSVLDDTCARLLSHLEKIFFLNKHFLPGAARRRRDRNDVQSIAGRRTTIGSTFVNKIVNDARARMRKSFCESTSWVSDANDERDVSHIFYCSDETIISNPWHDTHLIPSDGRPERRVSHRMTRQKKERQLHLPSVE